MVGGGLETQGRKESRGKVKNLYLHQPSQKFSGVQ